MADTIRSGNITVAYLDESRQRMISWSGSDDTVFEDLNTVYSELQDLFDASAQSDNPVPMTAQTPTEYTVGSYGAGESDDPWYIAYDLMERINGGALRTANWTRVTGSNTGIVVVPVNTGYTLTSADIGDDALTNATGSDVGTLLEIIDDGTSAWLVVRPADNTAANDWDSTSGTINNTGSSRSATQNAAALSGEQVWANFFHQLPIEDDTHMFAYAGAADNETYPGDRARITSVNSTTEDYWGDGTFDVCIPINDWKTDVNPLIDGGYVYWSARKYSTEYAIFEAQASSTSGGRNSVPMATKNDLNNNVGFSQVTLAGASTTAAHWAAGVELTGDTSGARAILTDATGVGTATPTLYYYLLAQQPSVSDHFGGELLDFNGSEAISSDASGTSTSSGATSAYGPAQAAWFTSGVAPTFTFGNYQADIDGDSTNEQYAVQIDCNANPLSEVYEWMKYTHRYGNTSNVDDIPGELYRGGEVYIYYGTDVVAGGTIDEGDDVLQETTGATGVVVSHDTTSNIMLLRDIRGTFATGTATDHTITSQDAGAGSVEMETADSAVAVTFAPNGVSPFGTFAGGTFFGARGVALVDWLAADENSFQLTPIEGGTKSRPQAFQIAVTNLSGTAVTDGLADMCAVYETDSNFDIDKTQYSSAGSTAIYAGTQVVDTTITDDTPATGSIMVRDASNNNANYLIRYASFTSATFTLADFSFTASGGDGTTVQYATGGLNAAAKRGDLVNDETNGESRYILTVDSDTQITVDSPFTDTTPAANAFSLNTMPIDDDTLDDVYVVPLHEYPTTDTASVSIQYVDTYYFKAVVRNNRAATKIIPFSATGTVSSGTDNQSVQTVRNTDTITS